MWVAAFRQSGTANEVVTLIQKEAQQGGLRDPQIIGALFGFLNQKSEAKPQTLPATQEAELLREVRNA